MSTDLNITSEDLVVMKHGDRCPVTAGTLSLEGQAGRRAIG